MDDPDTIGLIVAVITVLVVFIAGRIQERDRKKGPPV
jgi:hypothetical protein